MSVLSGLWNDVTGKTASDAANAAAADTYKKQTAAVGDLNNYAAGVPGQYNALGAGYNPYIAAGGNVLQMLMNGTGANGAAGNAAYTDAYRSSPGYQAAMETGMRSGERALNAANMGQSGRAALELQRRGMGIENQEADNFWNKLMGIGNQGFQATGAQAGLGAQGLGQQANLRGSAFGGQMNAAGTIGQGQVAGAQAQQQGVGNLLNAGTNLAGSAFGAFKPAPTYNFNAPTPPANGGWPLYAPGN